MKFYTQSQKNIDGITKNNTLIYNLCFVTGHLSTEVHYKSLFFYKPCNYLAICVC